MIQTDTKSGGETFHLHSPPPISGAFRCFYNKSFNYVNCKANSKIIRSTFVLGLRKRRTLSTERSYSEYDGNVVGLRRRCTLSTERLYSKYDDNVTGIQRRCSGSTTAMYPFVLPVSLHFSLEKFVY